MNNKLLGIVSMVAALFGQSAEPFVYSIPVQNPSFEISIPVQGPPDSCGYQMFGIPYWTSGERLASVLVPVDLSQCSFSAPPDGKSVALVDTQTISQNVGDVYTLLPHNHNGLDVVGVLKLQFLVANRFYWYDGRYSASLSLSQISTGPPSDTANLCSTSGFAAGDFTKITLICPEQRIYGSLTINLTGSTPDWSVLFDKVSLTFRTKD